MRTLFFAYFVTLLVYLLIGSAVSLFMGSLGPLLVSAGITTVVMCGFDFYGRWSAAKRYRRMVEEKKNFLRSIGIDVDALVAKSAGPAPTPAQGAN